MQHSDGNEQLILSAYADQELDGNPLQVVLVEDGRFSAQMSATLPEPLNDESGWELPPIRFHDLRHTAASLLLNKGVPPLKVSRRLGHSKASITLDIYGHLTPTMQDDLGERIDEWVTPVPVQLEQKVEPGS